MVDDCSNTRLSLLTKTRGGPIGIFLLANFSLSPLSNGFLLFLIDSRGKKKEFVNIYKLDYKYICFAPHTNLLSKQTNTINLVDHIHVYIRPCVNITIIETLEISGERFISSIFTYLFSSSVENILSKRLESN